MGAAVGDAFGMPLEFGPARPAGGLVREMSPGRLPAGSFTDDTEMALALADSLVEKGRLDGADLASRFLRWFQSDPPDVGGQTRQILSWLEQGATWEDASARIHRESPNGAGNGSAMRCWPVALAFRKNRQRLAVESAQQSRITHPNPDCTAACAFINWAIAELIDGAGREEAVRTAMDAVPMSGQLREAVLCAPVKTRNQLENTGWVIHTIESAVWGLLTTGSFEDAVVQVANLGDDADTAASVVGALAGAAYGLEAIPPAWRQALHGAWPVKSQTIWREADFVRLADRLEALNDWDV